MKAVLNILIADDHEMVRKGLRAIIEERAGWRVVAEAGDGRTAVRLARELRPQIAIVDFSMPELNGLEATRQIRAALPQTEVLVLTMHETEQLVREVLAAGARGFVLKSDAGRLIVQALETLQQHKPFFTGKVSEMLLQDYTNPRANQPAARPGSRDQLSPREREVMQLIAEGRSTKEAADVLGISVKTAETHRTNLMRKLNLRSVSEVVRYAVRNGLIEP